MNDTNRSTVASVGPASPGQGPRPRSGMPPAFEARFAAARALGQAVAVSSLYQPSHPVARRAIEEARAALERALRNGHPLTVGPGSSGWLIDGTAVPRAAGIPDTIAPLFKDRGWKLLAFWPGVEAPELAALCELAAQGDEGDPGFAAGFLNARGVRNITLGLERPAAPGRAAPRRAPGVTAPPTAPPAPPPPRRPPPKQEPERRPPFNAFLQDLLQRSTPDPEERARLYHEALDLLRDGLKEALEGQVAAAQEQLEGHARRLVAECQRTQRVLASVAEGRVTVDPQGRVLTMNAAAEQIAGKPLSELAGMPLQECVSGDSRVLAMSLSGARDPGASSFVVRGESQAYDEFRRSVALVYDPDGRVVGTYGVLPHAAKARETARLQEDFVSRVTHELKAPLTAITAALELLETRGGAGLPEVERSLLETSYRNAGRLRRLIDDLLDFSSLENGSLRVGPKPCDPAPLVEEAVRSLKPWAETKGIRLSAAPPPQGLGPILADGERVVQVLTNLLSNALKHTPAGGLVEAGVAADGAGLARFRVRDTGCGIPKQDQARIFGKFVQLQDGGGKREGVGLGLAIAADIVRLHGGAMSVESEPGQGATFSFTIPLSE